MRTWCNSCLPFSFCGDLCRLFLGVSDARKTFWYKVFFCLVNLLVSRYYKMHNFSLSHRLQLFSPLKVGCFFLFFFVSTNDFSVSSFNFLYMDHQYCNIFSWIWFCCSGIFISIPIPRQLCRLGLQNTLTDSLQRGKTPPPPNKCPGYNAKQSDGEAPVMLDL